MRARPSPGPRRRPLRLAATVAAAAVVAGCAALHGVRGLSPTTLPPTTVPTTTTTVAPTTLPPTSTTSTIPLPYPLPRVGACRGPVPDEVFADVADGRPEVPCTGAHGGETVAVLATALVAVGERPATRAEVPEGLADHAQGDCLRAFDGYLGESPLGSRGRASSLLVLTWSIPSDTDWALGARWVRCDAVVAPVPGENGTYAGSLRGALAGDQVPASLVACFDRRAARTRCDAAHATEALVDAVFPGVDERPGPDEVEAARRDQCDPAAAAAIGVGTMAEQPELATVLVLPSARQWAAGDHTATCAVTAADGRELNDSVRSIQDEPPPVAPEPTTTTTVR